MFVFGSFCTSSLSFTYFYILEALLVEDTKIIFVRGCLRDNVICKRAFCLDGWCKESAVLLFNTHSCNLRHFTN